MRKLLLIVCTIILFSNNIFANNVGNYSIQSTLPDITNITVKGRLSNDISMEYLSADTTTGVMFSWRDISISYNSPYIGMIRFSARLRNSDKSIPDLPITIDRTVVQGLNTIDKFYKSPVYCAIPKTDGSYNGWINYYNIIQFDKVEPINATFVGYIVDNGLKGYDRPFPIDISKLPKPN